jgi:hypothetical protein
VPNCTRPLLATIVLTCTTQILATLVSLFCNSQNIAPSQSNNLCTTIPTILLPPTVASCAPKFPTILLHPTVTPCAPQFPQYCSLPQ